MSLTMITLSPQTSPKSHFAQAQGKAKPKAIPSGTGLQILFEIEEEHYILAGPRQGMLLTITDGFIPRKDQKNPYFSQIKEDIRQKTFGILTLEYCSEENHYVLNIRGYGYYKLTMHETLSTQTGGKGWTHTTFTATCRGEPLEPNIPVLTLKDLEDIAENLSPTAHFWHGLGSCLFTHLEKLSKAHLYLTSQSLRSLKTHKDSYVLQELITGDEVSQPIKHLKLYYIDSQGHHNEEPLSIENLNLLRENLQSLKPISSFPLKKHYTLSSHQLEAWILARNGFNHEMDHFYFYLAKNQVGLTQRFRELSRQHSRLRKENQLLVCPIKDLRLADSIQALGEKIKSYRNAGELACFAFGILSNFSQHPRYSVYNIKDVAALDSGAVTKITDTTGKYRETAIANKGVPAATYPHLTKITHAITLAQAALKEVMETLTETLNEEGEETLAELAIEKETLKLATAVAEFALASPKHSPLRGQSIFRLSSSGKAKIEEAPQLSI